MTDFDEIKAVQRIAELYRERGREVTPDEVRHGAKGFAKRHGFTVEQVYDAIESVLLSRNPNDEPRGSTDD